MITRRALLGSPTALLSGSSPNTRPATLDVRQAIGRAVECILNRIDHSQGNRPWFAIDVADYSPVRLRHDQWDFGDTTGRFLESLVTARQLISPSPDARMAEQQMRDYLHSLFDSSGLIWNRELKSTDVMFSQGSALYSLVTDYEDSRDSRTRARIERMITALDRAAVHEKDYLWFPQVATKIAPCSHQAAYQTLAVVRFYELTQYKPALVYAERLGRWAFFHDPTLTADGVITKTGWEGHLHAWMDTICGVIRCARAGAPSLEYRAVCNRARRVYEWVKANWTTEFGWVADSVGSHTCETDTITSAVRLALELIKAGHEEYWDDIERFVRNQMVENQFWDTGNLHIQDPGVVRGLRGCFESWAAPNTLIATAKGDVEGCCINGGIRGLYLAWQNAVTETPVQLRVNLLINAGIPALEVASYLPYEGRLELHPFVSKPIALRRPSWLVESSLRVSSDKPLRVEIGKAWILIRGAQPGSKVVVRFDQPERHQAYTVAGREYAARWRGDTVTRMSPAGRPYPIFQRARLENSEAPLRPAAPWPASVRVHW